MAVVLVVDDEWGIAHFLDEVLTDQGHKVIVANNGRQALELAAEQVPALVVTDYMMPVMDGAGLLEALAANPDLAGVPIILMSSMPEETVAERCSGYAVFVRKPFRIFDLIDVVADLVGGQRPR